MSATGCSYCYHPEPAEGYDTDACTCPCHGSADRLYTYQVHEVWGGGTIATATAPPEPEPADMDDCTTCGNYAAIGSRQVRGGQPYRRCYDCLLLEHQVMSAVGEL
jgi:hypothetical protein